MRCRRRAAWIVPMLVLAAAAAGGAAQDPAPEVDVPEAATAAPPRAPSLHGEWRLFADDDARPGQAPEGFLVLGKDGKWRMSGSGETAEGKFFVEKDQLVLTSIVSGTTRVQRRAFKLDGEGLHLASSPGRYAHYKRAQ